MQTDFSITPNPNEEAAKIVADKPVVAKQVFAKMLPEIRARAFTVSGIESANALQRIRDAIAEVPMGTKTWEESKKTIVDELEPYLGDGADYRATLVLRTNGFQAFSACVHNVGMADEDTVAFQYLHGECKAPTPSHEALNGVIVGKHDPFWLTHTGPWGHLGCVCYKRPINPDQMKSEQEKDAKKNPDEHNVVSGAALDQLHQDTFHRAGRRYNIGVDGPDNSGFTWHPDNLKISLDALKAKYDPATWADFEAWGKKTEIEPGTSVWKWLSSKSPETTVQAAPSPEPKPNHDLEEVLDKIRNAGLSRKILDAVSGLPSRIMPLLKGMGIKIEQGKAFYDPAAQKITIDKRPNIWYGHPSAMIHEIGHRLHNALGFITPSHIHPRFKTAIENDWDRFKAEAEQNFGPDWKENLKPNKVVETMKDFLGYSPEIPFGRLSLKDQHRIGRFCDSIQAASKGEYGIGHRVEYQRTRGPNEMFAHSWSALIDKDQEYVRLFPETFAEMQKSLPPGTP